MNKPRTSSDIRTDIQRLLRNNGNRSFRPKEIAKRLGYNSRKDYVRFREVLAELEEDRTIARVKRGQYALRPKTPTVEGTVSVHPKGFGFLETDALAEDVYIAQRNLGTALDRDRVRAAVSSSRTGRTEAVVLEVVERGRRTTVGTYREHGRLGVVVPDDRKLTHDVYVANGKEMGASGGDKVLVSIDRFDDPHGAPEGAIISVIGSDQDPDVQIRSLAMSLGIAPTFSDELLKEADAIPSKFTREEVGRRLDLRDRLCFTIDPADAADHDDALHVERLPSGLVRVGVHIADVSHYVRPSSAVDIEALDRGTSVYLVDRVIPMLPERLSNELCSLRPEEDKLSVSCLMDFDDKFELRHYQIAETVTRSTARLSYEKAQEILEGAAHPLRDRLTAANEIAESLTRARMDAGSVDFDLVEVRVVLDDQKRPIRIVPRHRLQAHRLIEEFMLLANRTVARHLAERQPSNAMVYRVHGPPNADQMQTLAKYVRAFGHKLHLTRGGHVSARDLNSLLHAVRDTPEEPVIEEAALRAMAKAIYTTENIGHFGLAFDHYTHFTSPIRRYPDLMVHRILKSHLRGVPAVVEDLEERCKHCSGRERIAVEAERESVKMKQVEYAQERLGETFDGVISGVTRFGVFVEIPELLVEGMVHVRDMDDDYFEHDEDNYRLVGAHSGKEYRLGGSARVVIVRTDVQARQIDLFFADA